MDNLPAPRLAPAELITNADGSLTVRVTWEPQPGLDRLDAYAWGLKSTHRALAARLIRAINDGAIITPGPAYTDVDGNTGFHSRSTILGRTMNADLRRLGY